MATTARFLKGSVMCKILFLFCALNVSQPSWVNLLQNAHGYPALHRFVTQPAWQQAIDLAPDQLAALKTAKAQIIKEHPAWLELGADPIAALRKQPRPNYEWDARDQAAREAIRRTLNKDQLADFCRLFVQQEFIKKDSGGRLGPFSDSYVAALCGWTEMDKTVISREKTAIIKRVSNAGRARLMKRFEDEILPELQPTQRKRLTYIGGRWFESEADTAFELPHLPAAFEYNLFSGLAWGLWWGADRTPNFREILTISPKHRQHLKDILTARKGPWGASPTPARMREELLNLLTPVQQQAAIRLYLFGESLSSLLSMPEVVRFLELDAEQTQTLRSIARDLEAEAAQQWAKDMLIVYTELVKVLPKVETFVELCGGELIPEDELVKLVGPPLSAEEERANWEQMQHEWQAN